MFSSVFDKVVSPMAPQALAAFPPRAALPVPSSTLCCLGFVDNFLSHYYSTTSIEGDNDVSDVHIADQASSTGIAISAADMETIMHRAADLGGRLAVGLAETRKSKVRDLATISVYDFLVKVRGIFGNRLASIGREIRVFKDKQAERDETLLLSQLHALRNTALELCGNEKWGMIVTSAGESIAVCCLPLPHIEGAAPSTTDFLVFDPCPRPEMKLRGSYVVKFTTVR